MVTISTLSADPNNFRGTHCMMPFLIKTGHSVNLRTETCVLFFEETCFIGIIHCSFYFEFNYCVWVRRIVINRIDPYIMTSTRHFINPLSQLSHTFNTYWLRIHLCFCDDFDTAFLTLCHRENGLKKIINLLNSQNTDFSN